ncbi:Protein CBG11822 [Caenorhabditis briggsae]|uniref:Protein CBG11822 n=2 Tax=Caenorhabditis briggsae TaxID=6238 RepID=A8XE40_CAEBR|nr:Protein CBG11822 [Caenorhabditis briggsae]ULT81455.1 hypothetical protein L3Y34_011401 [Caenorhabditis briggsae]CAP30912.1 Protein CBG11822 [Caenorhabditis briggsae]
MDQRRKSFKTVYNGSDENRVQTPDHQHHDSDNMSSRLRERRSTRFGELSTAKETANTSNVRTVTNTIKQPNTEYSTKERQALKRLIIALGNKYAETIVLHRKASMEVGKLESQKKEQKNKILQLKTLQKTHKHGRNIHNRSYSDSFRRRFQEAQNSLEAIEKNLQKARKNRESTEEDMEEAEAEWKFEAMCSGEAYYEDGKWKWRY